MCLLHATEGKAVKTQAKMNTKEELYDELSVLRKHYEPFLQNHAPFLASSNHHISIKNFVLDGEKEITIPYYGGPLGYAKQTYEIIAVFKTVVYTESSSEFKYFQFSDAESPEHFNNYISKCKTKAIYETGVTAEYGDKLITLSTCEYSNTNGRLVLVAKKIDD